MTLDTAQVQAIHPAQAFWPDGVFNRAFEPLRRALDAQFQRCNADKKSGDALDPTPWLTRAGKGGPGYEQYRIVSLARHCLDVMFLGALTAFLLWKSGALAPEVPPDDEDAFVRALTRLLVIALFHDADKYAGDGRSRSPTPADVAKVYEDLAPGDDLSMTPAEIIALVNRVEGRGMGNAFMATTISALDSLLAKIVALVDGALGDAAGRAAKQGDDEDQALVDSFRERLRQTFAIELPPHRIVHLRQQPAILHEIQVTVLSKVPECSGLPPLVLSVSGEELTVALPESLQLDEWLDELRWRLGERRPTCKLNRTDGKLTLSHVGSSDALFEAVARMNDPGYLLRVHVNDQSAVQDFIVRWTGNHAPADAAINARPDVGKLFPVLAFKGRCDDLEQPLARALATVALLRGGIRNPTKEFNGRVRILEKRLESAGARSLEVLRQSFGADAMDGGFDIATRQTLIALQVAADISSERDFRELAAHFFNEAFQVAAESDEETDPGVELILRSVGRQLGLLTPDMAESEPYAAAPDGGTCLLCGAPTTTTYEPSEFNIPELKKTAFSNRIGHRKDIYSESGATYICAGCIAGSLLLKRVLTAGGQSNFKFKDADVVHTATPLRNLILPGVGFQEQNRPLHLLGSDAVPGRNPVQEALAILPWNLDLSDSLAFYFDTLTADLTEQVSYLHNAARFAWLSGNPVHVFRIRQHRGRGAFMSELVPALVDDLLRPDFYPDKPVCRVERAQLPDFIARLNLIQMLLREKDSAKLTVLNDLKLFSWWPVAWFVERRYTDDKGLNQTGRRLLKLAQESFTMSEHDTPLRQLAELATQIQRRPQRGASASGNLQGLAFDTALIAFQEFHLQQRAEKADTVAATMGQLNDTLSRRDAYAGGKEDVTGRYRRFAEAAYDVFEAYCHKDGDLSSKTRRYLRAAYVTYFLEIHEVKKAEKNAAESPVNTAPESFELS